MRVAARRPVVLKLGGELLESDERIAAAARLIATVARRTSLVVVHGGGRQIDAALAHAGINKRQVDGLRITDDATLDVVVAVLAGTINTQLVAAANAVGAAAVGLTAADAGVARLQLAAAHCASNGSLVNLGRVGEPAGKRRGTLPITLIDTLCAESFVPVIACVGADAKGQLLNINADTLAANVAGRLRAARLVIAGGTPGVLGADETTLASLGREDIDALVRAGTASAGMVAKLRACRAALDAGVPEIVIADGRSARLRALVTGGVMGTGEWTRVR